MADCSDDEPMSDDDSDGAHSPRALRARFRPSARCAPARVTRSLVSAACRAVCRAASPHARAGRASEVYDEEDEAEDEDDEELNDEEELDEGAELEEDEDAADEVCEEEASRRRALKGRAARVLRRRAAEKRSPFEPVAYCYLSELFTSPRFALLPGGDRLALVHHVLDH